MAGLPGSRDPAFRTDRSTIAVQSRMLVDELKQRVAKVVKGRMDCPFLLTCEDDGVLLRTEICAS